MRLIPLTIAVALGPLIDILQFATTSSDQGAGRLSQIVRGSLMVLMVLSTSHILRNAIQSTFVPSLLGLGMYGLAWTAVRGDAGEGLVFGLRVSFLCVTYLCAYDFATRGWIGARWATGVAWAVLLTVLMSQIAGRVLDISAYDTGFDFPGYTGQPSLIAASVCAVFPIFFVRAPLRSVDALGALLALASVAGTQRRSAFIAIIAALAAFAALALFSRRSPSAFRAGGMALAAFGVVFLLVVGTPLGQELGGRFADLDIASGGTGSGRSIFQRIAIDHILHRGVVDTVFGEGLGPIKQLMTSQFGAAIGAHNDWIDVVFGLGVVGSTLFFLFNLSLVALAFKVTGGSRSSVMMAIAGFIVMELGTGGALDPSFAPMFALCGWVAGASASRIAPIARHSTTTAGWSGAHSGGVGKTEGNQAIVTPAVTSASSGAKPPPRFDEYSGASDSWFLPY